MNPITFSLPWPPAVLSPNGSHGGWRHKQRAKKRYYDVCYTTVLADRVRRPSVNRVDVMLVFVPPTRNALRNVDNLIARMKAGLDGVAAAWDLDDAAFVRVGGEIARCVTHARSAAEVRVEVREHLTTWVIHRGADGLPSSVGIIP